MKGHLLSGTFKALPTQKLSPNRSDANSTLRRKSYLQFKAPTQNEGSSMKVISKARLRSERHLQSRLKRVRHFQFKAPTRKKSPKQGSDGKEIPNSRLRHKRNLQFKIQRKEIYNSRIQLKSISNSRMSPIQGSNAK